MPVLYELHSVDKNKVKKLVKLNNKSVLVHIWDSAQWGAQLLSAKNRKETDSTLSGNLHTLFKNKQFQPLRIAILSWFLLVVTIIITTIFSTDSAIALLSSWSFDTPANYTYDSNLIDVSSSVASLRLVDQTDNEDSVAGFGGGIHNDTQWDATDEEVELDATGLLAGQGSFRSRIIDAGVAVDWNNLIWSADGPYTKELPNDAVTETQFEFGNANMTGNMLLLHMNEANWSGVSGEVEDSSPTGNDGSTLGGANTTTDSVFANGGSFDGVNEGVIINPINSFPSSSITAEYWVNTTDSGEGIISYSVPSNNNEFLIFNSSNLAFYIGSGNISSGVSVNDGQWHHVVVTWTSVGGQVLMYKDGVQVYSGSVNSGGVIDPGGSLTVAQEQDSVGGGFDLGQAFSGSLDEIAIYNRVLTPTEVSDHYRRSAVNLGFRVRSCDDPVCDTELFIGPDGTATTYYSEENSLDATQEPEVTLNSISSNRYFQYEVFLQSDINSVTPELETVDILPAHYPGNQPTVETNNAISYEQLTSFSETLGAGNTGFVSYQLSNDGASWYYFDGFSWELASLPADSNSATIINDNFSQFIDDVGVGNLLIRAYLTSNGSQQVELDAIEIDYESAGGTPIPTPANITTLPTINSGGGYSNVSVTSVPEASVTPILVANETNSGDFRQNLLNELPLTGDSNLQTYNLVAFETPQLIAIILAILAGFLLLVLVIFALWRYEMWHLAYAISADSGILKEHGLERKDFPNQEFINQFAPPKAILIWPLILGLSAMSLLVILGVIFN